MFTITHERHPEDQTMQWAFRSRSMGDLWWWSDDVVMVARWVRDEQLRLAKKEGGR